MGRPLPCVHQKGDRLNIHQRLNEIKKHVGYVQKDEKKVGGLYKAVTHDAVTAATRAQFVEQGVMVVPHELAVKTVDSGMVTGKGNPIIRYEAQYQVQFVNVDEPSDFIAMILTAHALDEGDKAPGKALSYAVKYAILKILQLETGEDDEAREVTKPKKEEKSILPGPITPVTGVWDALDEATRIALTDDAMVVVEYLANDDVKGAVDYIDRLGLEAEEKIGLWTRFDSKARSAMKRHIQVASLTAGMKKEQ